MKRFLCISITILLCLFGTAASAAVTADLKITKSAQDITLTLSKVTMKGYDIFYLANPSRLVVDLKNTDEVITINKTLYANTPIKNIRIGKHEDRRLRVVLDLAQRFDYRYVFNHDKLIIILQLKKTTVVKVAAATKTAKITETTQTLLEAEHKKINNSVFVIKATKTNEAHLGEATLSPIIKPNLNAKAAEVVADNSANKNSMITVKFPRVIEYVMFKIKSFSEIWQKWRSFFNKKNQATNVANIPSLNREIIIVIDPGHGGKDPGAVGKDKTKEKDVVLAIAKDLQVLINQEQGFRAILTRDGDDFLSLSKRMQVALTNKADLFISLHADTYPGTDYTGGVTMFALSSSGATSAAARWLAEQEDISELAGNTSQESLNLRSLLVKLAQNHSINTSLQVGNAILKRLEAVTHLHKSQVEQASFIVLKSPNFPSLLIESGFISDLDEETKLKNPQYQAKLAYAITQGIKDYFLYSRK